MTPLEAAARALFDLDGWREHWIEQDLLQVERYKAKARDALTAAVNELDVAGLSWEAGHEKFRAALLLALIGKT